MQRILTYSYRDDSLVTTLSLWCTSGIPSVRNTRWTLFFLFIAEVRDGRHLFLIDRQSGGHRHLSNGSNYKSNILYLCVCFKSLYLNYPSRIVPLWRCRLFFSLREAPRSFFSSLRISHSLNNPLHSQFENKHDYNIFLCVCSVTLFYIL